MKKMISVLGILFWAFLSHGQMVDTTAAPTFIRGQITLTNNGISLIPNFSLNKPALLNDLSVGRGRFSFDPMFRFALDAQPWTFVFWFRYKVITNKKWLLSLGAHPAFLFRSEHATINGITKKITTAQRYAAWEIAPTHFVNKRLGLGLYYLGSHGLTNDLIQWGNFIAARALIMQVPLGHRFNFSMVPQVYFLQQDDRTGTYWNSSFTFAKNKFPLTFSANLSHTIQSEIAGKDFLWSIGLVYNINNSYYPIMY